MSYCSQKFWWLSVDPERSNIQSCCSADEQSVNIEWLKSNSGKLFNTPKLVNERKAMLKGFEVPSCESNCWQAEKAGLPSRRTLMNSNVITHTEVVCDPEVININLGSDCNLTCSYCCKQFSTSWMRDIQQNGSYLDENRYKLFDDDLNKLALGQNKIKNSENYLLILNEARKLQKNIKRLVISGGEPFLYNGLSELVKSFETDVSIYTGLGVNTNRLQKIITEIPKETTFVISAENVGMLYEFNRYGNSWEVFKRNYAIIQSKFKTRFNSVISNLTIHGYDDFQKEFGSENNTMNLCMEPNYLGVHVLDPTSKENLSNFEFQYHNTEIQNSLLVNPTDEQILKFKTYINEFARRRDLSLKVFPEYFQSWLGE